ncbi:hypothetical protein BJP25_05205 [Actinokineospora bangkokensis]|uniref:Serine hydrolase n=1 Tax=Actinokineospora bangkokensis TaxID=1193682 RepID=A0A1Q9LBU9_9PSEU|nr:hypothetical protein BJP25_05205 [Actinokineospora bangkokensis]
MLAAPRLAIPAPAAPPAPAPPPRPAAADVVAAVRGVEGSAEVGVLVVDRQTGDDLLASGADRRFRSASLVKLLIAVDVLAAGADAGLRQRVATMLRLSDDGIASELWVARGGSALVARVAGRVGLTGTRPPARPGQWGDVLITARDVARVYDHVLDELPGADRALVVDALAAAPRRAADGFDQHFGIPDGLAARWAVKQGWSNSATDIVTHSTGLVGEGWRYVVVLLTEHPRPTRWSTACASVTAGARSLAVLFL